MVFCSLDAMKKSSKKKEAIIKKKIVEMLQKPSTTKRDRDDENLGLELGYVG